MTRPRITHNTYSMIEKTHEGPLKQNRLYNVHVNASIIA